MTSLVNNCMFITKYKVKLIIAGSKKPEPKPNLFYNMYNRKRKNLPHVIYKLLVIPGRLIFFNVILWLATEIFNTFMAH